MRSKTEYGEALSAFSHSTRAGLAAWAAIAFGYLGIYAGAFNLYLLRLGYDERFVGLAAGTGLLTFALLALPAGLVGHRIGSSVAMRGGLALLTLGTSLLLLGELLSGPGQVTWLLICYAGAWAGAALFIVNSYPFLMAVTPPAVRGHAFALQTALAPLAGLLGNLAAGILLAGIAQAAAVGLDHPLPYRLTLLLAPVAYGIGFILMRGSHPIDAVSTPQPEQATKAQPVAALLLMAAATLLLSGGEGAVRPFFNVYLDARWAITPGQIGLWLASGQLVAFIAALAAPLILAQLGQRKLILLAAIGISVGAATLGLVPQLMAAGLSYVAILLMLSLLDPAYALFHQQLVEPRWRPAMAGMVVMTAAGSQALMAIFGGQIVPRAGFAHVFLIGAGITALGTLLLSLYRGLRAVK